MLQFVSSNIDISEMLCQWYSTRRCHARTPAREEAGCWHDCTKNWHGKRKGAEKAAAMRMGRDPGALSGGRQWIARREEKRAKKNAASCGVGECRTGRPDGIYL